MQSRATVEGKLLAIHDCVEEIASLVSGESSPIYSVQADVESMCDLIDDYVVELKNILEKEN